MTIGDALEPAGDAHGQADTAQASDEATAPPSEAPTS